METWWAVEEVAAVMRNTASLVPFPGVKETTDVLHDFVHLTFGQIDRVNISNRL